MKEHFKHTIQSSIEVKQQILSDDALLDALSRCIDITVDCLRAGHRLWFCGNGGSAADAQHLAAEFSGRFYHDRPSLAAEALHCNSSYMTAVANDYSYEEVYARLVQGYCNPGDVLIGLSTSGNSANILKAFAAAQERKIKTIAFTGHTGGRLKACADILINVPSSDTPRIQESHILLGHILCEMSEERLFPKS